MRRQSDLQGINPNHPHAGGENNDLLDPFERAYEPSPRGWGELLLWRVVGLGIRTIPTRVGRTRTKVEVPHRYPNHPHAGGENP